MEKCQLNQLFALLAVDRKSLIKHLDVLYVLCISSNLPLGGKVIMMTYV